MKRTTLLTFIILLGVSVLPATRSDSQSSTTFIAFDHMYGVEGPFLGKEVRGIPGDDLPWEVESATGRIDTEGHVEIHVRGIVFADDPSVPEDLVGKNDEKEFRAAVSCTTEGHKNGKDTFRRTKRITDGFPSTESGDADIVTTIDLPNPCVTPIVYILAGEENDWFAVTGVESEEEESSASAEAAAGTLIEFDHMYGVDGPFLERNIRGIPGDDLPWEVESATGRLDTEGNLEIHVRGLVFGDDPSVPDDLVGKNDETEFRAAVSCLTEVENKDDEEVVRRQNVITDGFPATESGDSDIETKIELPNPCAAPMVFVLAGEENDWFAVNGFESEEGE